MLRRLRKVLSPQKSVAKRSSHDFLKNSEKGLPHEREGWSADIPASIWYIRCIRIKSRPERIKMYFFFSLYDFKSWLFVRFILNSIKLSFFSFKCFFPINVNEDQMRFMFMIYQTKEKEYELWTRLRGYIATAWSTKNIHFHTEYHINTPFIIYFVRFGIYEKWIYIERKKKLCPFHHLIFFFIRLTKKKHEKISVKAHNTKKVKNWNDKMVKITIKHKAKRSSQR